MIKLEFPDVRNSNTDTFLDNIKENIKRDVTWFNGGLPHKGKVIGVCPGPSLEKQLSKIRNRKGEVWSVNRAYPQLLEKGIVSDAAIFADPHPIINDWIKDRDERTTFYVASQCDPSVFDALEGSNVVLYHLYCEGVEDLLKDITHKPVTVIHGGSSVSLKLMYLAYLLGYRTIDYYGFDGSFDDQQYSFTEDKNGERLEVYYNNKKFLTTRAYAQQATEFFKQLSLIPDCIVRPHGNGLIPYISTHRKESTYV